MSTKTPIYELYQWEGSDLVSRLEMNENFLLLEQALAAKNTYHLLQDVTVSTAKRTVSINMRNVDWSKWHEVVIECTAGSTRSLYVNVNGEVTTDSLGYATAAYCGGMFAEIVYALGVADLPDGRITLYSNQNPSGRLSVSTVGPNCSTFGGSSRYNWSQVQTLDLCPDENGVNIPAGARFKVWGIQ